MSNGSSLGSLVEDGCGDDDEGCEHGTMGGNGQGQVGAQGGDHKREIDIC